MPTVFRSGHPGKECRAPPRDGSPGIRCGIVELVAGQMSGGWESMEGTTASARAQQEMKATTRVALVLMTAALIRRNCRRGPAEPGPTQETGTAPPAGQAPAAGRVPVL